MCLRCEKQGTHKGHSCKDLLDVFNDSRNAVHHASIALTSPRDRVLVRTHPNPHAVSSAISSHLHDALTTYLVAQESIVRSSILTEEGALRVHLKYIKRARCERLVDSEYLGAVSRVLEGVGHLMGLPDQPLRIARQSAVLGKQIAALKEPPAPLPCEVKYCRPGPLRSAGSIRAVFPAEHHLALPQDRTGYEFKLAKRGKRGVIQHGYYSALTTRQPLLEGTTVTLRVVGQQDFTLGVLDNPKNASSLSLAQLGAKVFQILSKPHGHQDFEVTLQGGVLTCRCDTFEVPPLYIPPNYPAYVACSMTTGSIELI